MKRAKKILFSAALCIAFASPWAGADTVVDLDFNQTAGDVTTARSRDVDTVGVEQTYNFSDSSVLFNGSVALNQKIYGGFQFTTTATNTAQIRNYRFRNDGNGTYMQINLLNGTDGGAERMRFIHLWDGVDYGFAGMDFNDSSGSSFSISDAQNLQEGLIGGFHFVLRDSGTYYIANQLFGNTSGAFTASMSGDLAGLEWASFDATLFTGYNADAQDLGNINIGTYSAQTFENVEAVGFIGESFRWTGPANQIDDFQVNLVPEPATLGMIGTFSVGFLFIRRRFMI